MTLYRRRGASKVLKRKVDPEPLRETSVEADESAECLKIGSDAATGCTNAQDLLFVSDGVFLLNTMNIHLIQINKTWTTTSWAAFKLYTTMHPLFADSTICPREKQQALNRVRSDPGVPDVASTSPFWLCDPHPQLSGYQSASLSTEADIVIIGSGITGASIARTLLQNRIRQDVASEHPTVVMLEARDICSGATGRNGGHILETGGAFAELADGVGMEAAKKIFKFRLSHLHEILNVADQWGLTNECQARKVQFLSVFFDEEPWSEALEGFWRFKGAMPVESADWRAYSEGEIPKVCLVFL